MIRTLIASVALLGTVAAVQADGFQPIAEQIGFEELNTKKETRNTRTFSSGSGDIFDRPDFQDAFTPKR